jgi:hypothetical protein
LAQQDDTGADACFQQIYKSKTFAAMHDKRLQGSMDVNEIEGPIFESCHACCPKAFSEKTKP